MTGTNREGQSDSGCDSLAKPRKWFYNRGPQPTFCLPFCLMV